MKKEPGDTNVSDALTKSLDEKRMTNLLTIDGLRVQRRAHRRRKCTDEMEIEELYVTEENCKLFFK